MKKIFYFWLRSLAVALVAVCVSFLTACSSDVSENDIYENVEISAGQKISLSKAKEISDNWLSKNSRSGLADAEYDYVLNEETRSGDSPVDTVAYIINYKGDNGFSIISSVEIPNPVLAYSEYGNFNKHNEIATDNFVKALPAYIDYVLENDVNNNSVKQVNATRNIIEPSCVGISLQPKLDGCLHQDYPYSKYVPERCPAGCVAVATMYCMQHGKKTLDYHGVKHDLYKYFSILGEKKKVNPTKIVGGVYPPLTEYDIARDSIAKIMYWIGLDVDMTYTHDGSSAEVQKAYNLLKKLNYRLTPYSDSSPEIGKYNLKEIIECLNNKYMIFLYGIDYDRNTAHAWIVDGCNYCVGENDAIINPYLHCDWGWGGLDNGYYSGDVFSVSIHKYKLYKFFGVEKYISIVGGYDKI